MSAPEFTVASFNSSARQQRAATRRIREVMTGRRALLFVGRQEARWQLSLPASLRRRGWRRSASWRPTQVWYREARGFAREKVGNTKLTPRTPIERRAAGPTRADEKRVTWVAGRFRRRGLVFGSVHLVPSVYLPLADKLSEAQVRALASWARGWMDRGYDVVLVGDFNFRPNHPNAAPLRAAGLRCVNHDDGATHGSRTIDHVWVSARVDEVWSDTVPGHRRDDHRIVLSRLRLVGA